jgi:hypothetical protein
MFSNGDKYEGFFKNDKFEGEGTLIKSCGDVIKGTWKEGEYFDSSILESEWSTTDQHLLDKKEELNDNEIKI